jgi:uracil-DNA glycosylase
LGAGGGLEALHGQILACRLCRDAPQFGQPLPHEPSPVLRMSATARLLIASQAPGIRVHNSGLPFNDASGDRLRDWMGVDRETFYDSSRIAIVPMGFCFPGHTADKGDLPPRRECSLTWHGRVFAAMPQIETVLAIGSYSQAYHFRRLGRAIPRGMKLGELVRNWRDFAGERPLVLALPHPSWRNSGWLKRNPWFATDVLPVVRSETARLTQR